MNFLELAKARYSVRSFKQTPIEDEKLAKETAKVYYEEVKKIQSSFQKDFIYLGVMKSPIGRIQNKYRIQILIRLKPDNEDVITKKLFEITEMNKQTGVSAFIEINPQNLS